MVVCLFRLEFVFSPPFILEKQFGIGWVLYFLLWLMARDFRSGTRIKRAESPSKKSSVATGLREVWPSSRPTHSDHLPIFGRVFWVSLWLSTAAGDAIWNAIGFCAWMSWCTCAHMAARRYFPLSGFCGGGLYFLYIYWRGLPHFQVNHYPNSPKSNDRMTPIIPLRMKGKETKNFPLLGCWTFSIAYEYVDLVFTREFFVANGIPRFIPSLLFFNEVTEGKKKKKKKNPERRPPSSSLHLLENERSNDVVVGRNIF